EKGFSQLEGLHSAALRAMIAVATTSDLSKWSFEHMPWLLQAIAFQRARTMLEVEKEAPAMQALMLHMFAEWVRKTMTAEKAAEIIGPIESGEVVVSQ